MVPSRVLPAFRSPLTIAIASTSTSVIPSLLPPPSTSGFMHLTIRMSLDFSTNVGVSIGGASGTALTRVAPKRVRSATNKSRLRMANSQIVLVGTNVFGEAHGRIHAIVLGSQPVGDDSPHRQRHLRVGAGTAPGEELGVRDRGEVLLRDSPRPHRPRKVDEPDCEYDHDARDDPCGQFV